MMTTTEKEPALAISSKAKGTVETEETMHPLFMTSLPSDFESNSGLAAIASLLDCDDDDEEEDQEEEEDVEETNNDTQQREESLTKIKRLFSAKEKVRPTARRKAIKAKRNKERRTSPKKATVNEAQLFLKMWKL